jgi:polysaccharide pyruvyl transferase WcaK-like protein
MRGPRSRPARVALYGEFGTGNLGNDASLLAAVDELRAHDADVEISCLCPAPDQVARRYGLPATAIRSRPAKTRSRTRRLLVRAGRRFTDLVRMVRIMRELDLVMVPGMGVLEAGSAKPGSYPSEFFMTAVAARVAGTPFALVSVGVDHAHRRSTRTLLRWTLRLAAYRSFRDAHSRDCASGYGAPRATDPVYPDLVFGLDVAVEQGPARTGESVGVGIIAYRATFFDEEPTRRDAVAAAYLDSMTSFVAWLLDRGLDVTLLTGDRKDEEMAEKIHHRLTEQGSAVRVARPESLDDLIGLLRQVDYLVASRYHNVVAAALTATPVISVNYLPKNGALMSDLGLGRFHQPLEELDGERLREQFLDLQRSSVEVAGALTARCREYRERLEEQWSVLARMLPAPAAEGMTGVTTDDRTAAS